MRTAYFQIHPDLKIFLPKHFREDKVMQIFTQGQTTKHLIESLGIPHTEIGLILCHGIPTSFQYQVQNDDVITVLPSQKFPHKTSNDVHRFVIDNHLGRLTAHLRMLGFDSLYHNDYNDEQLAEIASQQKRILLTRDRRLLMRKLVMHGYWVRSKDPMEQTTEVILRYNLINHIQPFSRCIRCNELLISVPKEQIIDHLLPLTKKYFDEFSLCPSCEQIYWKGSHHERMEQMVEHIQSTINHLDQ
jgi:uncharacterized protein with PIN domain